MARPCAGPFAFMESPMSAELTPPSEPTPPPQRVTCYVDGFNLYHGLMEHTKTRGYRWLNLKSLAESRLLSGHVLERVVYFTSVPPWNRDKAARHRTYIAALESEGVEIVEGKFQKEFKTCFATCQQLFETFTEKLTDVNIATRIISDAIRGAFDWAYLVSADADQAPTIRALQQIAPSARVHVIFPPRRNSAELEQIAHHTTGPLNHRSFKRHVFPDKVEFNGRTIQKPTEW